MIKHYFKQALAQLRQHRLSVSSALQELLLAFSLLCW